MLLMPTLPHIAPAACWVLCLLSMGALWSYSECPQCSSLEVILVAYLVLGERAGLSYRFSSSMFPGRAVDQADWILCLFPYPGFQDLCPKCLRSSPLQCSPLQYICAVVSFPCLVTPCSSLGISAHREEAEYSLCSFRHEVYICKIFISLRQEYS